MSADTLVRAPIALLPVLLFLAGLVQLDGYKLVRMRMMIALLVTGALAAGASYVVNNLVFAHFHGSFVTYSRYVSPWIEESLKAALLVFLIRTRRVGLPVDAGIAGFAIGTGFAVVENLYYLAARPHTALAVQVIRGFGTAIMHGGTAAILAMISNTLYERRPSGGLHLLLPGLFAAVALHTGYNYLLVRPALATLATLLVLPNVAHATTSCVVDAQGPDDQPGQKDLTKFCKSDAGSCGMGSDFRIEKSLRCFVSDEFYGEHLADAADVAHMRMAADALQ